VYLLFVAIRKYLGFPLVGTYQGVILTYMTFALPFSIWMMRGFFETIPRELEEAAYIDGCGVVRALFTIIVPVSIPGIISVALYSFLLGWEEVLFASVLTNKATRTVAVGLRNFSSTTSTYWNEMMAAAVAVTIPIVIIFLFLQRYFIRGLTAGSVKG
jgi:multiple sugar transport system permease protein